MAGKKEEIVTDVRSAVKLEQELQAHVDNGVVLIDVYSAEWGSCKALAETFRALNNDGGCKLRILSAECHSIIASAKNPEERNHQRPKNIELVRETLPEAWLSVFEERAGLAKPFFMVYKEGRRCAVIDGVNTPVIRSVVKELRAIRQPPENFLSGALLAAWKQHIHPDESEVSFERFLKGLLPLAGVTEPLSSEERVAIQDALAAKETKVVTADNFLKWVGEDSTVPAAFAATLPEYATRAGKARADREAEEKLRSAREVEAAQKDSARREKEEAEAKADAASHADTNIDRWSKASGLSVAEAADTPALRQSRKALAIQTSEKVAFTAPLTLLPADTEAEVAAEYANRLSSAPTISKLLLSKGATVASIHNIRRAVEKRFPSSDLLASGKLACVCLTSTEEEMANYFGAAKLNILSSTLSGTLDTDYPAVALGAITNAACDVPEGQDTLYFTAPATKIVGLELAEIGATVIVPPLSLFSTRGTKKVAEGDITIVLERNARAILTAHATTRPASAVALTSWYGAYEVVSKEEGRIVLGYKGIEFNGALDGLSESVRKAQSEEDDLYTAISQLQRAIADKAKADGITQEPFDEAVVVKAEEQPSGAAEEEENAEAEEPKLSKKTTPAPTPKGESAPIPAEEPKLSRKTTPVPTPKGESAPIPAEEPKLSKKTTPVPTPKGETAAVPEKMASKPPTPETAELDAAKAVSAAEENAVDVNKDEEQEL